MSASSSGHHATNLLHEAVEAVERQQKLREEQAAQVAAASVPTPATASDGVQSDAAGDAQYGDVRTKNIPDLYFLFTNDALKKEPLTQVLHSDPFVIPRLTDNVPEYRPAFNPLSILEGEEQLLPRYFRLDPFEGIPGAADKDAAMRDKARPIRVRTGSASGAGAFVVGKTSTFMGTLPRQSEFSEIPVPDSLFQTQQTFRPTPPPPPAPHPSYASKNIDIRFKSWSEQAAQASSSPAVAAPLAAVAAAAATPAAPLTPTAITDAMFLTSLHQCGSDRPPHDYYTQQQQFGHAYYQQQQQQGADSEKLTRYLPTRSRSPPSAGGGAYLSGPPADPHHPSYQELHASSSDIRFLGSIFEDNGDDDTHGPSQPAGDPQSLQPIAKKPRSKNVFRPCTAPGCTKGARGKSGLCQKHGGGKRCSVAGCAKGAQGSSTMCLFHGGGYRCTVDGCSTGARGTSGLCAKHGGYKRGAKELGADNGGSASPSSASGGKRARTQHSDDDGDEEAAPGPPRVSPPVAS